MGCSCQPEISHSPLSSKLTENLKVVTFIFVAFSVLKIFIVSTNNLLNDILLAIILYALYTQLSYFMGILALFFIIFDLIFESLSLLQIIQNIVFGFSSNGLFIFVLIKLINVIIYCFLLRYTFLCSREFKALFVEQKSGGVFEEYQMFTEDFNNNNSRVKSTTDFSYQRLNNNDNEPKGYKPFSGQGYVVG